MTLDDFFNFKSFITPAVIKNIYKAGALLITVAGLLLATSSPYVQQPTGTIFAFSTETSYITNIILGMFLIVIGNILWRAFCEYLVIQFNIHEVLIDMRQKMYEIKYSVK